MARQAAVIPNYRLYGEEQADDSPGFGHIETIAERSALHDWEIAPHRHRHGVQVLIVSDGEVEASLDGQGVRQVGPCHVTVPAGTVHGFRFAPATRGWVLTLGQEFARRTSSAADPLGTLLARGGHGALPEDAARRIALLAGELLRLGPEWHGAGPFHPLAEALLRSLPRVDSGAPGTDDRRIAEFRQLIERHLTEHRPVSFYAALLGTTARTLTRLTQRRLGLTPLEAIHRRRALEARRLLRYTNASVAQIAEELGFDDASYFSRFYVRMTGHRPTAAR